MAQSLNDIRMTNMLEDQLKMVTALHTVACDSDDAEIVRTAMAALMNTSAGRAYVELNPIHV